MNYKMLIIFIVLSFINVVLQTIKSLLTINGTKFVSAISNAIAYGLYTIVLIYTVCDLPLLVKVIVTAITNFFGVYISKWLVDKFSKDKLWKIECAIQKEKTNNFIYQLKKDNIPFNYIQVGDYNMFNCYCKNQKKSSIVKENAKKLNGKISAYESKPL